MVAELRLHCPYGVRAAPRGAWEVDPDGCPEQILLDSLSAHEDTCGFAIVRCKFENCLAQMRRSELAQHEADCGSIV